MSYKIPASAKAAVESVINECTQHLQVLLGPAVKAKLIIVANDQGISLFKELVCDGFNVDWIEVKGLSRKKEATAARHAFVYLCKKHSELNDADTMKLVNRHRTLYYKTVSNVEGYMRFNDPYFSPIFNDILNQLKITNATETI